MGNYLNHQKTKKNKNNNKSKNISNKSQNISNNNDYNNISDKYYNNNKLESPHIIPNNDINININHSIKNDELTINQSFENTNNTKDINIEFVKDLAKDSYAYFILENTFTIFKSINDILYLIYSNENKSIISYDLIENKKINEIKNAHTSFITNFKYYFDKINIRDIILSISCRNNNINLWNAETFECILILYMKSSEYNLTYSACLFENNNQNYIVVGIYSNNKEFLKIYDLQGNEIGQLPESENEFYFVCVYCDKLNKNYIISGNLNHIDSFDYNSNKIYKKYYDNLSSNGAHNSIIISEENITKLIESCTDGNIRIWNFHSAELLLKITVDDDKIFSIFLWKNKYLFVGCRNTNIIILDLNKKQIIKKIKGHDNFVLCIKKINHPKLGECFISQGYENEKIKLWKIKEIKE